MSETDPDSTHEKERHRFDELEERVDALEAENKELKEQLETTQGDSLSVSRRQTLAGLIGGGALLGVTGTGSAQNDDGDPFADEGHDHSGDYLGEDTPVKRIDVEEAHASEVYNAAGDDAAIQTAWDGMVVPIAPGLGASDAIDPSKTATPVQDGINAVANAGSTPASQGGKVILPPEPIEEATTIDLRNGVQLIGQGVGYYNRNPPFDERDEAGRTPERVSKIRILKKGVDLLRVDADQTLQNNRLDGFIMEGPRGTDPRDGATETGKGLHVTAGTRLTRCTIGAIEFINLSDSAIYTEADLVECNFGTIVASGVDAANNGNAVFDFRNTGYSNHIDLLATYPKKRRSGEDSDGLHMSGFGDLSVNVLNFRGTLARGVFVEGTDGWVTIGGMNYEPGPQNEPHVVIESQGPPGLRDGTDDHPDGQRSAY